MQTTYPNEGARLLALAIQTPSPPLRYRDIEEQCGGSVARLLRGRIPTLPIAAKYEELFHIEMRAWITPIPTRRRS